MNSLLSPEQLSVSRLPRPPRADPNQQLQCNEPRWSRDDNVVAVIFVGSFGNELPTNLPWLEAVPSHVRVYM